MMNLAERLWAYVQKENLFTKGNRLLLAVSGGIDSVVLAHLFHQLNLEFSIAHCNFKLRGAESDRDEVFVRGLANHYGKEIFVRSFDTNNYSEEKKVSIQVAARELRYEWFDELLKPGAGRIGFDFIVTAHHKDDNIETMLMHFFRGTGIQGIRGMLPKNAKLVRPLLSFSKNELKAFASAQQLQWVEDSSNDSDKYSRNFFRNKLIPSIKEIFPAAEENLAANLQRFRETEQLYNQAVDQHKKKLLEKAGNEFRISVLKLASTIPQTTVLYEILKDFGFSSAQVPDILALLESDSGKYVRSLTHRIIRNRSWLLIAPVSSVEPALIVIEEQDTLVTFANKNLKLHKEFIQKIETEKNTAQFPVQAIRFPLILRKWKPGDYFYPLGMKKKKKLARFFIDQKLSKTAKEEVWVLEMNRQIVWVVGLRIDDRFKVGKLPAEVLTITLA